MKAARDPPSSIRCPSPVRDAYDRWAACYDDDVNATRDLNAAVLQATPLPLDGAHIVEYGAGTGKNTAYLAARAARVVALDLSEAMLAKARARVSADHVSFVRHDITGRWPVPKGSADLVIGTLVLEHVDNLRAVFKAARRVLRPGGSLVVCELHPYRQWRGAGARFVEGPLEHRVEVYTHAAADYVNTALASGFALRKMAEISDPLRPDEPAAPPRLLQLILTAVVA